MDVIKSMILKKYQDAVPSKVELEEGLCIICSTDEHQTNLFDGIDKINSIEGLFGVDCCSNCGLYITNPRPTQETIGHYYPDDYAPYISTEIEKEESKLKQFVRNLLNTKATHIPELTPGKLLEIGCASGSFLNKMRLGGWDVKGLEFSDNAVEKAVKSGLDVEQGSVLDYQDQSDNYDLVVAWMVMEHIHDPVDAFGKIYGWLKSGGKLAFSVPNAKAFDFNTFKHNSYNLQVPTHLFHFTPETIEKILVDQGFVDIKIHHQVTLVSIVCSLGYFLQEKKISPKLCDMLINFSPAPKWLSLLLFPVSKLFSWFGQTGRMTVWASK